MLKDIFTFIKNYIVIFFMGLYFFIFKGVYELGLFLVGAIGFSLYEYMI